MGTANMQWHMQTFQQLSITRRLLQPLLLHKGEQSSSLCSYNSIFPRQSIFFITSSLVLVLLRTICWCPRSGISFSSSSVKYTAAAFFLVILTWRQLSYLTEPSHLKRLCMWIVFSLLCCKSYIHLKVALKGDNSYSLNIFSRALWVHFLRWDDCDSVIESVTTQLAMVWSSMLSSL